MGRYLSLTIILGLALLISITGCSSAAPAPTPTVAVAPSAAPVTISAPISTNTPVVPPTATSTPIPTNTALPSAIPTTMPSPTPPVSTATSPPSVTNFSFDKDVVGGLPAGATIFSGAWAVRAEPDAPSAPNALCQTATTTFPAMSLSAQKYTDVTVTMRFKPVSGNTDRAAGIIFRIQDKDNYYILRANALEANVNLYKYVAGQRTAIKEGSGNVETGKWQELRVEALGNRLRGFFNGQLVVETTDETYKGGGGIGLWTKADSTTCFDDVQVATR